MTIHLPTLNASLNGLAAVLLFLGWRAIRSGSAHVHQRFMLGALLVSALFLCSYLTYHFTTTGVTRYPGTGFDRILYLTILGTHTVLAMAVIPLSLAALWHAFRKNFTSHVHVTRWLLPIWMYVSVTGVVIYVMLYVLQ